MAETIRQWPLGWRQLVAGDISPEVNREMAATHPDLTIIKNWLANHYARQNGGAYPPEEAEARKFLRWLVLQRESDVNVMYRKHPRLQSVLFETLSAKAQSLAQRHCVICNGARPEEQLYPVHIIPIRITPQSRQAINSKDFTAYQAAVRSWLDGRTIDLGQTGRFCVALTFVMSPKSRDKDLDNMVKALQDALARALSFDDKHIQHLDVIKLIIDTEEDYVVLRLAPSALNEHDEVLVPIWNSSWVTKPKLELSDFRTG